MYSTISIVKYEFVYHFSVKLECNYSKIYVLDYDCNAYLLIRFKMRRNTIIHIKQNRKSYQIERNERV